MLRTLYWVIGVFLDTLLVGGVPIIWAKILEWTGHEEKVRPLAEKVMQKWGKIIWRLSGSKAEISGQENIDHSRPLLLVSNHQSIFDIALLLAVMPRPLAFVSKIELKKIPIVHFWMSREGSLFLDRGNVRQSVRIMKDAVRILSEERTDGRGACLVIFPEGTRSRNGSVAEFKRGSLGIAAKAKVPVLPVCIDGTYKIFENNRFFRIKASRVKMTVLPQITAEELAADKEMAEKIRDQIAAVLATEKIKKIN